MLWHLRGEQVACVGCVDATEAQGFPPPRMLRDPARGLANFMENAYYEKKKLRFQNFFVLK